jgi:hypothetical protein
LVYWGSILHPGNIPDSRIYRDKIEEVEIEKVYFFYSAFCDICISYPIFLRSD